MKRYSVVLLLAVTPAVGLAKDKHPQHPPVPVFLYAEQAEAKPGGFVSPQDQRDAKEMADALKDLRRELSGKKCVALVETPEKAKVVLRFDGRGYEGTGASETYHPSQPFARGVTTKEIRAATLRVTLIVGEYKEQFVGVGDPNSDIFRPWRAPTSHIAKEVVKWIDLNLDKLP